MHNVTILELPHSLPLGWDIADQPPSGFSFEKILNGPPQEKTLADFCITTEALSKMEIPKREFLIEPFIMTQSMNMLYAKRGVGKTWAASQMAISVASGLAFFAYKVMKKGRVLYVDGEMTLFEIQDRFKNMEGGCSGDIEIMPSELLYQNQQALNFHYDEDQARFLNCLQVLEAKGRKFDLLIFDNLSSLLSGKDENDNTEMENFLRFLISLRHMGYTVLLIHHAGKGGDQRGGSRREDLMDTVIKLEEPKYEEGQRPHEGARFIITFTKTRGKKPKPHQLDVRLVPGVDGLLTWSYAEIADANRSDEALKIIHDDQPRTQTQLAELMNVSKSRISHILGPLRKKGLISDKDLTVTLVGKLHLANVWPDKYEHYRQIDLGF